MMADRLTAALGTLQPVLVGILLIPAGTTVGALTERIALRRPLKSILGPKVWSTVARSLVSCGAVRLLCVWSGLLAGTQRQSGDNDGGAGDGAPGVMTAAVFGLWTVCFAAGARLGSALQPVGLTGGIACGKSTVAAMLGGEDKDDDTEDDALVPFSIIDVDIIGHDILVPDKMGSDSAYERVVAAFGNDVLESPPQTKGDNGVRNKAPIDRRKLGDVIFPDPTKRRTLNRITHPLISKIMMKRIVGYNVSPPAGSSRGGGRGGGSIVAVDIPLLFEVGIKMRALFGLAVVVACRPSVQLERLMSRNEDLTREQCEKRIGSQMPIDAKVRMADVVIWNDGSVEELTGEVNGARDEVVGRVRGWGGVTVTRAVLILGFGIAVNALMMLP